MAATNLVGKTFGRLTVIASLGYEKGRSSWYCQCSCGWFKITDSKALQEGATSSCGCMRSTHGKAGTPLYKVWASMRERCNNPNSKTYKHYGERGIRVCERWDSFECFMADMGPRPDGTSIERKNNDGDYDPSNCYWATDYEQAQNTTRTRLLSAGGRTMTITNWCRELGGTVSIIHSRLKRGWTEEAACLTPVKYNGRNALRRNTP